MDPGRSGAGTGAGARVGSRGVHGRARPAQEPGGGAESVGGGGGSAVGSAGGSARGSAAGVHLEVAGSESTREPGTHPRTPQRPGRTRRRSGLHLKPAGRADGGRPPRRARRRGARPRPPAPGATFGRTRRRARTRGIPTRRSRPGRRRRRSRRSRDRRRTSRRHARVVGGARVSSAARGAAVRLEAVARVLFPTAGFRRERPRRVETRRVEPGDKSNLNSSIDRFGPSHRREESRRENLPWTVSELARRGCLAGAHPSTSRARRPTTHPEGADVHGAFSILPPVASRTFGHPACVAPHVSSI